MILANRRKKVRYLKEYPVESRSGLYVVEIGLYVEEKFSDGYLNLADGKVVEYDVGEPDSELVQMYGFPALYKKGNVVG